MECERSRKQLHLFKSLLADVGFCFCDLKGLKMSDKDLKIVCNIIDSRCDILRDISDKLWLNPELNYEEFQAHDLLTNALQKYGFEVTRNYLLPTAFRGEYESKQGKGPMVAVLLEYDALPGIGHACGHNLISEAGIAAAIGIKAAMEADPTIAGKLVVLGTPAEEGGGGKAQLIAKGAFKDIKAAMMVHPRPFTMIAPPTLSILSCTIDFKGKESHASAFPWEGINALDAAVCFYQSIGLLRQQIKPSYRMHAIITKGGMAPNIIPAETQLKMFIRAPTRREVYELKVKVENCIQGAASSTGCTYTVKFDDETCYENLITNSVLGKLFGKFSEQLDLPEADTNKMREIPAGSTDMGNVSHVVPSIQPVYAINTDATNHTKEFAEAAHSAKAQRPTLSAAKSMAMTTLTLFRNPDILSKVRAEFDFQHNLE